MERRDFVFSLEHAELAALGALGSVRSFERGRRLCHEGQIADGVFILRSGVVKITRTTPTGREVVLAFRGVGDLVGELAALDGAPRSATICAVDLVEALCLTTQAFLGFLEERPAVALVLLRMLSSRLRDADAKRIEFSTFTTIERVAVRLLEFSERFGYEEDSGAVRISLPLSQEELAGATGASLESIGRALQTMRVLGCVETGRREIRILDRRALAAMCARA
jgi:CRP-like cAMP-binding protein